jgi:hypothetical protein
MKLIGTRGNQGFLIQTKGEIEDPKAKGFAYNMVDDIVGQEEYVLGIVKFGYWDAVSLKDLPDDIQKKLTDKFPDLE